MMHTDPTVASHLDVVVGLCSEDPKDFYSLEDTSVLRADQTREREQKREHLPHVTSAFVLVLASQPTTAL